MSSTNLLNRDLPKWPQLIVTGNPVTEEQARDIIRRTDSFLVSGHGGNNDTWNKKTLKLFEHPESWCAQWGDLHFGSRISYQKRWQDLIGAVPTEYVETDRASCCFVGGPHGWMHVDGSISFSDNVGKWPSVSDVLEDWKALSKAFPYIDVGATLRNGESCEERTVPVVSFRIKDGKVSLVDPKDTDVHKDHEQDVESMAGGDQDFSVSPIRSGHFEQGIPAEVLVLMIHDLKRRGVWDKILALKVEYYQECISTELFIPT